MGTDNDSPVRPSVKILRSLSAPEGMEIGAMGSLIVKQDYTRDRSGIHGMRDAGNLSSRRAQLHSKSGDSGVPCCIIGDMSAATAQIPEPLVERRLPPGPSGLRFYFSLLRIPKNWLRFLGHLAKNYGDISFFHLLTIPICFINRPDYIESVLVSGVSDFTKSKDYAPLKALMGDGLLTSEGEFWQKQRKLVQPAFHRERIAAYGAVMVNYAEKMVAGWRDGETHDAHKDMMKLTLDIVGKTLFDADVTSDAVEVSEALEAGMERYSALAWFAVFLPPSVMTPWNWIFRRTLWRLDAIIYRIIRARRESKSDPGDLLSILVQAQAEDGSRMTDQQLRDEVMTLFLAGHETTANALAWTWYLLSLNPEAEARLHTEMKEVLGGRSPRFEDLPRLRYTQNVVKESLRLFPPAWGIGRETLKEIPVGDYRLPAGTNMFISQWVMHRHPRYFEQPEEFRPERWTEEFEKQLPKFAYFPFGGGPRVCVGASFASMEVALLLATIAQRYRLTVIPGHPVKPLASVTLRPKHGIRVKLQKRSA
jgi:cytochrome P450